MKLQKKIINLLGVKSTITPKIEIKKIIVFLKEYLLLFPNLQSLILGISGGQDSTLTGKLCQMAVQELRKETKKNYFFIALRLPYGIQKDERDCHDAINFICPDECFNVNIKKLVLSNEYALKQSGIEISDYIRGNIKARERMNIQYSVAAVKKGIVVGTAHAAELITGFFTKFGDNATDINPIAQFNKRQGRMLLESLNCPKHLYLKQPTADLEDDKPQQADESALGITYNQIDDYLEGKIITNFSRKIIENLYLKTMHKRRYPIAFIN